MSLYGLLSEYRSNIKLGSPRDSYEIAMMKAVNGEIEKVSGKSGITIKLGSYTFDHIIGMNSNFPGDPKADVSLVGLVDGKPEEVAFISYKAPGGAKAFQQFSGLTNKSGTTISRDPIVLKFLKSAGKHIESFSRGKSTAVLGIPAAYFGIPNTSSGQLLVRRSMFGPEYKLIGRSTLGGNKNNVHVIVQGHPTLKKTSNGYLLTFSDQVHSNNESINWVFRGDYTATLAGTFRNNRGFEVGSTKYNNFRVGLYPFVFVKGRRGAVKL